MLENQALEQNRAAAAERIVDVDIHVLDTPAALAPHCDEMPWRKSLEMLARQPYRHLDVPAFGPSLRIDPPLPGGHPMLIVKDAAQMRRELDKLGITDGLLMPDNLLKFAVVPQVDYAAAVMRAYNRWLAAEWLHEDNGLWGAVLVSPQDPESSAREIENYAGNPRFKAIYLPTASVNPLWGARKYDPIMKAAEASGMPLLLHSVSMISPSFPHNTDQFENNYARQVITHPFCMMANLTSIMHLGLPARYPRLKFIFTEAGISWVPHMMWRFDRYWREFRRQVPFFKDPPSEYMKRQMWFATQPLEEPENPQHLVEQVHQLGGADRVMFASDWPHHDFDHPRALRQFPFKPEERRKIMFENAVQALDLPPLPASQQRGAA